MGSRGQPQESRAAILKAAAKEFAENGIAGARTDAIAREARVNKALLYYYFKDKETLYGAVLDEAFSGLKQTVFRVLDGDLPTREKMLAYAGAYFDFIASNQIYPRLMQREMMRARDGQSPHIDKVIKNYIQPIFGRVGELMRKGIADGEFRPVNPAHFVPSMVAMIVFYFSSAPMMRKIVGFNPLTAGADRGAARCGAGFHLRRIVPARTQPHARSTLMSARNRFFILLGIIFVIAATYYFLSTDHSRDLVLIGTVDANQVIVSAQVEGRIQKLLVDEGTPVKAGDLIAVLDPSELQAQEAAATANIDSLQHKVTEMRDTEQSTSGSTSSDVANAQAKLSSAKAQLLQAKAALDRTESDSRRAIELAKAGITSDQERVQAETNLQAAQATVQAQQELVRAAQADLNAAVARTHQANAAKSTVASTQADLKNALAMKNQAAVRLGYTNVYAPVSGTVSVRAARQGEVVNIGAPIVTVVDLNDTWARVAIPETYADHIGYGDVLRVRLPGGTVTSGKVFFKGVEGDFATQRDVSRRKRDIKTIVLKVRMDNPKGAYVPGMTAEVLVSPEQLKGGGTQNAATAEKR